MMLTALIAGIGGASLGVEIAKCLRLAGGYRVRGCDISPLAFGHYCEQFHGTDVVRHASYVDDVLHVCERHGVDVLVPGGEQPAKLLAAANERIAQAGIKLAGNTPAVVRNLTDKAQCFERLAAMGVAIPKTVALRDPSDAGLAPVPAIIKPSSESGGSSFVFYARDRKEIELYASYLLNNGLVPIAQEYLSHEAGEFTVGVLSSLNGDVVGAIALKRAFHVKLSVMTKGADFLISSGYSQGHIADHPQAVETAITIAGAVGSRGPINVQGRFNVEGSFVPFEINPRFSASTYLRALAGFNEVDHHIRELCGLEPGAPLRVKPGWYLRGLSEVVVADNEVLQ